MLTKYIGATSAPVERKRVPTSVEVFAMTRYGIDVSDEVDVADIATSYQIAPMSGVDKPFATLADGSAAVVRRPLEFGSLTTFGFWPGVTYWNSPERGMMHCCYF